MFFIFTMSQYLFFFIFIVSAFYPDKGISQALLSVESNDAIESSHSFSEKTTEPPEYVRHHYHTYAFKNGTSKGDREMPATFYYVLGQALPENNGIFFMLDTSDIRSAEAILSAQIRVMVEIKAESNAPQPPLPSGQHHLVLFDKFSQRPVKTVTLQGGGAKWFVFPVLDLVKRWIRSPCVNHGVFIKLQTNDPQYESSVNVMVPSDDTAKDNTPLLVVQTQNKPWKVDTLFTLTSHQQARLRSKSRHSRAIRDEGPCSRRLMLVKLNENLNWKNVIFPAFYDAYRCGGECKFPLSDQVNPTGHAIVRSILYSTGNDDGTGEPCCVPTKLSDIHTLEYNGSHYAMKLHEEMVVQECGCR